MQTQSAVSQVTSETCAYSCQQLHRRIGHTMGTALETGRKAQATVGLYAPNLLGYTRATMVGTKGYNSERRS
jgi:hypothetical protein